MRRLSGKFVSATVTVFIMASLLLGVGPFPIALVSGAQVTQRRLQLSDSLPGGVANYIVGFDITTPDTLGSVKVEFCSNTALFEVACNAPAGFDVSGATLSAQTGETGFIIDPLTTPGVLILSRAASASVAGPVSFTLTGVQNASAAGSQYARFSTYATSDATGLDTDRGSVAYALNQPLNVSAEVPPYLQVCIGITISGTDCNTAAGNYVNLGEFSTARPSTGQTQAVVATNAANGYILTISGQTMASGNNLIPRLESPNASVTGTSQFGINARANANPSAGEDPSGNGVGSVSTNYNQPDRFMYQSGDIIASHNDVEDYRKYTITYLVNIARSQAPGVYSSTFTYTGVGNF